MNDLSLLAFMLKYPDGLISPASSGSVMACIAFAERTYGKSDPDYAAFSERQQQRILRRLNEEWTKSECKETPPLVDEITKK